MNKQRRVALILAVALVILSIIVHFVIADSNRIPSERRMARIIADLYIVDAAAQARGNLYNSNMKNDKSVENAYHTVLSNYGITKAEYDSAVAWYAVHPDLCAQVYERVVNILSQREADVNQIIDKRDSVLNVIKMKNDSLRVFYYSHKTPVHIPIEDRDSVDKKSRLKFVLPLDSIRGGHMTMSMTSLFPRKNMAKSQTKMSLVVTYNDTIKDTTSVNVVMSHISKEPKIEYDLRDTIDAVEATASFIVTDEWNKMVATLSDLQVVYMPYEITDSVEFDEIQLPSILSY